MISYVPGLKGKGRVQNRKKVETADNRSEGGKGKEGLKGNFGGDTLIVVKREPGGEKVTRYRNGNGRRSEKKKKSRYSVTLEKRAEEWLKLDSIIHFKRRNKMWGLRLIFQIRKHY